ncbi:MAG TPA: hypothetical protein PLS66_06795 [Tepiditoga sp.]|nr:hypothetical protein [Tepiditoga sp.]
MKKFYITPKKTNISVIFMNTDFETLGKNKFLKLYNEIKKCI